MLEQFKNLALTLTVEDPEGIAPAVAHCVLVEMHFNCETQACVALFKCWRSLKAFEANRKAFNVVQISLPPKAGGEALFDEEDSGAALNLLGEKLLEALKKQNNL